MNLERVEEFGRFSPTLDRFEHRGCLTRPSNWTEEERSDHVILLAEKMVEYFVDKFVK
ncbi:hypothetical protein DAPPUDRAFT_311664 [Daphnia pulex]|uniref:Uncharacterized protein n=1 Tax=Daphnia pulex TaxID=6669 RepID=E9FXJ4_DAPPU|nr:hypothetical protein DAPPUDRAFT_311664 [Daphnia pulex]|eukprot:EFX88090.1 hypothetical protein DAPPUDRAFT_311664 [Daphnia pulex]